MFNRAANMKLPYDQARELLNPLLDKLDASEARNILNSAVAKSSELKDEMYASLSNLPRPEKEDLLKKLNPNIDWSKLSDSEINQKLREIVSSKPDLEKLMQYLPDATALETVKDLIREAPDKMMGVVNEAISEARKLELIKEGMLKDVNSQISSALAHISPDRIKGLALEEFSKGSLDVCGETFHPLDWVQ